ncbi:alpha/beta fold hydrolase [Aureimonas sp. Leaf454]|uniref:alpha/beta hydrolase n=1 Tax=Aureimonas sp. Leaf454 TaxID=1736381 RepID=UPI001FCD838E|nr:alpha/beta fold hydrolase [Aureimonas sp. Leaf454]
MTISDAGTSRLFLLVLVTLVLALGLAGCATRPGAIALVPVGKSVPGARLVTLYLATDRERLEAADGVGAATYGSGRGRDLAYAEVTISVPPGHEPGRIEWSEREPGPEKSFATLRRTRLTEREFRRRVAARARAGSGEAAVFVHGFNYSLQEGLFRLAQLSADSKVENVPVLFAWPSEAAVAGYVADRDAVTFSRDHLVRVLSDLSQEPSVRKVTLVGHSMGGWLVMESLRQMKLLGRDRALDRLDVVLAAPDIDVDVFRTQIATVGPMKRPMMILVSKDDRALAVSSRLAGGRPRIGAADVEDPCVLEAARENDLRVVDISTLDASDRLNHDRFVSFAGVYAASDEAGGGEAGGGGANELRQAGAYVFNAAGAAIASPFTLVGGALAGR